MYTSPENTFTNFRARFLFSNDQLLLDQGTLDSYDGTKRSLGGSERRAIIWTHYEEMLAATRKISHMLSQHLDVDYQRTQLSPARRTAIARTLFDDKMTRPCRSTSAVLLDWVAHGTELASGI